MIKFRVNNSNFKEIHKLLKKLRKSKGKISPNVMVTDFSITRITRKTLDKCQWEIKLKFDSIK